MAGSNTEQLFTFAPGNGLSWSTIAIVSHLPPIDPASAPHSEALPMCGTVQRLRRASLPAIAPNPRAAGWWACDHALRPSARNWAPSPWYSICPRRRSPQPRHGKRLSALRCIPCSGHAPVIAFRLGPLRNGDQAAPLFKAAFPEGRVQLVIPRVRHGLGFQLLPLLAFQHHRKAPSHHTQIDPVGNHAGIAWIHFFGRVGAVRQGLAELLRHFSSAGAQAIKIAHHPIVLRTPSESSRLLHKCSLYVPFDAWNESHLPSSPKPYWPRRAGRALVSLPRPNSCVKTRQKNWRAPSSIRWVATRHGRGCANRAGVVTWPAGLPMDCRLPPI